MKRTPMAESAVCCCGHTLKRHRTEEEIHKCVDCVCPVFAALEPVMRRDAKLAREEYERSKG